MTDKKRVEAAPSGGSAASETSTPNRVENSAQVIQPGAKAENPTYHRETLDKVGAAKRDWEEKELASSRARIPERREAFTADSGIPIPELLTPADRPEEDYLRDVGFPGRFPFTR